MKSPIIGLPGSGESPTNLGAQRPGRGLYCVKKLFSLSLSILANHHWQPAEHCIIKVVTYCKLIIPETHTTWAFVTLTKLRLFTQINEKGGNARTHAYGVSSELESVPRLGKKKSRSRHQKRVHYMCIVWNGTEPRRGGHVKKRSVLVLCSGPGVAAGASAFDVELRLL